MYVHKVFCPVIPASEVRRESFLRKIPDKPEGHKNCKGSSLWTDTYQKAEIRAKVKQFFLCPNLNLFIYLTVYGG